MVVMGNEEKPPTTAAARIGMTMSERFSLLRLVIGTRKIAAKPPNAAPMAQLAMAMTSGEIPCAAAAVGFSATADVANPNRVYLYTNHERGREDDDDTEDTQSVLTDRSTEDRHRARR